MKSMEAQCGKTRNSLSPKKIFRQINSLVLSLVKSTSLSRNFCQKSVRENFRNFHTVGGRPTEQTQGDDMWFVFTFELCIQENVNVY